MKKLATCIITLAASLAFADSAQIQDITVNFGAISASQLAPGNASNQLEAATAHVGITSGDPHGVLPQAATAASALMAAWAETNRITRLVSDDSNSWVSVVSGTATLWRISFSTNSFPSTNTLQISQYSGGNPTAFGSYALLTSSLSTTNNGWYFQRSGNTWYVNLTNSSGHYTIPTNSVPGTTTGGGIYAPATGTVWVAWATNVTVTASTSSVALVDSSLMSSRTLTVNGQVWGLGSNGVFTVGGSGGITTNDVDARVALGTNGLITEGQATNIAERLPSTYIGASAIVSGLTNVVHVTDAQRVYRYEVTNSVGLLLLTNDLSALTFDGQTRKSWAVELNFSNTNAITNSTSCTFGLAGNIQVQGDTPTITAAGWYVFECYSDDGATVNMRQTWPSVRETRAVMITPSPGISANSYVKQSSVNSVAPAPTTTNFFSLIRSPSTPKIVSVIMYGGVATNKVVVGAMRGTWISLPTTIVLKDLEAISATSVATAVTFRFYSRPKTSTGQFDYLAVTSETGETLFQNLGAFERDANENEISAYNLGYWRP